jgi:hypothetical protein
VAAAIKASISQDRILNLMPWEQLISFLQKA